MNRVTSHLAGQGATLSYPGKGHPLLVGSGYGHLAMILRLFRWKSLGVLGLQDAHKLGIDLLEETMLILPMYF